MIDRSGSTPVWHPGDRTRLNALVYFPFILLTPFILISVIEGWDRQFGLWFKMMFPLFLFYMGAVYLAVSEHVLRRMHGPKQQRSLRSWRWVGGGYIVFALLNASLTITRSIHPNY